jgi:glycerol-3-phosphate acyltransferase PlsY
MRQCFREAIRAQTPSNANFDRTPNTRLPPMNEPWFYLPWALASFLLGSVSVGDIVASAKGVDIRSMGTGNPGTANIYREIGPRYGIAVLLLDVMKGAVVTVPLFLLDLPTWIRALAVAALIAGHLAPLPWKRPAGTGMAMVMGATAGLVPLGGIISAPFALLFLKFTRNVGYTGGLFFFGSVVIGWAVYRDVLAAVALFVAATVIFVKARIQYWDQ